MNVWHFPLFWQQQIREGEGREKGTAPQTPSSPLEVGQEEHEAQGSMRQQSRCELHQ